MIPKCMSQMNSPEWLRDGGAAQPRTHQNAHRSGRKCSRGPPHQCPEPGKRAGTLREGERERERERERENKGRGGGK